MHLQSFVTYSPSNREHFDWWYLESACNRFLAPHVFIHPGCTKAVFLHHSDLGAKKPCFFTPVCKTPVFFHPSQAKNLDVESLGKFYSCFIVVSRNALDQPYSLSIVQCRNSLLGLFSYRQRVPRKTKGASRALHRWNTIAPGRAECGQQHPLINQ